ncbi:MAG TPA: EutP/PduV family microcompartment system protein [Anaerolineae bacterium]|nr:EutP/PduV family microcompartment system protein [Anaerolineae bacterium]HMR67482.1 EutP/PduV family microcompartment system protein [Anaerolineae bacterium]
MTVLFVPTMTVEKDKRVRQVRFMIWGGVNAGKTTLINALQTTAPATARKTQMIEYLGTAIDTPGEYAELGHLRRNLQAIAADAKVLLVVQDVTRAETRIPPNFFSGFPQPIIGAVTKMDLATGAAADQATRLLRQIGVSGEIFYVSAFNGSGLDQLRQSLLTYLQ